MSFSSVLPVTRESLGELLTMNGVNRELGPLIRTTAPPTWQAKQISEWSAQQPLFASWIFVLGILPIDRHSFYFEAIGEWSFSEASSSWTNRVWRHRRQITEADSSTVVEDQVCFEPRLRVLQPVLARIYKLVFEHRHRRLVRLYNQHETTNEPTA